MARSNYPSMQAVIDEIDVLMKNFVYTKKDIGYGIRWTFTNGMWFDLIDYEKEQMMILRVGRGARLVRKYPVLHGMFDAVLKVIAKFEVRGVETLEHKHVIGLFELLDQAPAGIGAFD